MTKIDGEDRQHNKDKEDNIQYEYLQSEKKKNKRQQAEDKITYLLATVLPFLDK